MEITECGFAIDLVLAFKYVWVEECITEMSVTLKLFLILIGLIKSAIGLHNKDVWYSGKSSGLVSRGSLDRIP